MLLIAALIVFGLLAPSPSRAVLRHCTSPWSGTGDTVEATCHFTLGGGSVNVYGLALAPGAPHASVKVQLLRYGVGPTPIVLAECGGSGVGIAQCSGEDTVNVPPVEYEVVCVARGVAVRGIFSCRTV
jgi:hypothetical protein